MSSPLSTPAERSNTGIYCINVGGGWQGFSTISHTEAGVQTMAMTGRSVHPQSFGQDRARKGILCQVSGRPAAFFPSMGIFSKQLRARCDENHQILFFFSN